MKYLYIDCQRVSLDEEGREYVSEVERALIPEEEVQENWEGGGSLLDFFRAPGPCAHKVVTEVLSEGEIDFPGCSPDEAFYTN